MQTQLFWGRQLFLTTPPSFTTQMRPALKVGGLKVHCQRCGQSTWRWQAALPRHQYYCPPCLNLGRMSTLGQLYHLTEPNQFSVPNQLLTWTGQLSPLQSQVAKQIKQTMLARQK
ncbi:MAG: DNA/RNA helicase, partial [Limosilactobacillus sp.]|nr:DNA/RNA helicase [Limosilactobacillus sp.]